MGHGAGSLILRGGGPGRVTCGWERSALGVSRRRKKPGAQLLCVCGVLASMAAQRCTHDAAVAFYDGTLECDKN